MWWLLAITALTQADAGGSDSPMLPDAGLARPDRARADESPSLAQSDPAGDLGELGEAAESADGETESMGLTADPSDGGLLYSADVSDEELERLWHEDAASLGSVSVGSVEAGRLLNGIHLGTGPTWQLVTPENAWGTRETIDGLMAAATAVHEQYPTCGPLRVNHIGKKDGGYLRPHQSHQSGRDADLGFYYDDTSSRSHPTRAREQLLDPAQNFALLKALVTLADVQVVLVDRRVQQVLYDWALAHGEDRGWLDSLFRAGAASLVQHARGHRDHFHVRFFSPRSQELGRRLQPLLAKIPEQNLLIHRVQSGDSLGKIAAKYGSTVALIQKANGLTNTFLRLGRTLNVPLRGPCTNCPVPPPLVVPPRRLPPVEQADDSNATAAPPKT